MPEDYFSANISAIRINIDSSGYQHKGQKMSKRCLAFTLAEVLIVIGIIGTIAEITIPTLIRNTTKQTVATRTEKFYSTINQAIKLSEIDNGSSLTWTYSAGGDTLNFFNTYLANYMKVLKIDSIVQGGQTIPRIYLADGSTATLWNGSCVDFQFDANGDKKPNTWGRDIFVFLFCPSSSPIDQTTYFKRTDKNFGAYGENRGRAQALTDCTNNAGSCSELLLLDGWQFKDDYPYIP